ncbi:MAG: AI-2E family transporter [Clostridia bacterium]|nr:AI-2E family transporter [Clostridia bacterium]
MAKGETRENALRKWFGERRFVRLMLLAALLTLGVIHFEWMVSAVFFVWSVARPLIVGAAIAYILEIVVKLLEKIMLPHAKQPWVNRSRRWVCIVLAVVLILFLLILIISIVIPGLTDAFTLLAKELPSYVEEARNWALDVFKDVPTVKEYIEKVQLDDWDKIQNSIINWALNGIAGEGGVEGVLGGIVSNIAPLIGAVTSRLANFLISLMFAFFLLGSKDSLHNQFHRVLQAVLMPRKRDILQHILETANHCFSGFIIGAISNALFMGVFTWLGMRIFGMPYALMVGVVSGVTSVVPIIGGYIGAAAGTFLVFTANPGMALWFLLFIVILQTVDGNLVSPRLVGSSVGIPSLWVLAAVSVGGGIGGIAGMVMAVPLTATLYMLIREWVNKRNALQKTATIDEKEAEA